MYPLVGWYKIIKMFLSEIGIRHAGYILYYLVQTAKHHRRMNCMKLYTIRYIHLSGLYRRCGYLVIISKEI